MYYIVKARYVKNTNEKLSPKTYEYFVNTDRFAYENLGKLMSQNFDNPTQYIMWHIKNTSGEKSNPIIITDLQECPPTLPIEDPLQEILKMEPAGIYDIITGVIKQKGELLNTDIMKWNSSTTDTILSQATVSEYVSTGANQYTITSDYTTSNNLYFKDRGSDTVIGTIDASLTPLSTQAEQIKLDTEKYEIVMDNKYYTIVERKGKEKDNMFNKMFKNIEFGKITDGSIRMSIYGPAFKSADGSYIAYANEDYIDATGFVFNDMDSFCFKMPVGEDHVDLNDFIVHNGKYCRVVDLDDNGNWVVEDVYAREVKTIMSVRSPFGFNFLTKIITFGQEMFAANKDNPFGSILPMMMLCGDSAKNDNSMMMAMMMMNNTNEIDPMMMYLMCGDAKNNKDLLPMLMMMNSKNNPFNMKPQHKCKCSCGE